LLSSTQKFDANALSIPAAISRGYISFSPTDRKFASNSHLSKEMYTSKKQHFEKLLDERFSKYKPLGVEAEVKKTIAEVIEKNTIFQLKKLNLDPDDPDDADRLDKIRKYRYGNFLPFRELQKKDVCFKEIQETLDTQYAKEAKLGCLRNHLESNRTEMKFAKNFMREKESSTRLNLFKIYKKNHKIVSSSTRNLTIKSLGPDRNTYVTKASARLKKTAFKSIDMRSFTSRKMTMGEPSSKEFDMSVVNYYLKTKGKTSKKLEKLEPEKPSPKAPLQRRRDSAEEQLMMKIKEKSNVSYRAHFSWMSMTGQEIPMSTVGGTLIYDDNTHMLYVMGGMGCAPNPSVFGYSLEDQDWRRLSNKTANSPISSAKGSVPLLYHHSTIMEHGMILIFGGLSLDLYLKSEPVTNQLYLIEPGNFRTRELKATFNQCPKPRRNHSVFVYDSKMFIFGGWDSSTDQYFADIWAFCLSRLTNNFKKQVGG